MPEFNKFQKPNYNPDSPRCDEEQYNFLLDCIKKGKEGIKDWNLKMFVNFNPTVWLQKIDLSNTHLEGIILRGAHLEGAILNGAYLEGAYLEGTHLEEAQMIGVNLKKAQLVGTQLKGSDLKYADFQGANLPDAHLERVILGASHFDEAYLVQAHLRGADLSLAHFEGANLSEAHLEGAILRGTYLQGTILNNADIRKAVISKADLRAADFSQTIVDGQTLFSEVIINKWNNKQYYTNFNGVGLNDCRIHPGIKQLLEYNIRRDNWNQWYNEHNCLRFLMIPFWWLSDYGRSASRIIWTFFTLALLFAVIYATFSWLLPPGIIDSLSIEPYQPRWHYITLCVIRPFYFSVVTMTTLGFGDMYAYSHSLFGHLLLTIQVLLGYILLGALITRFAIMFTAGGPAGKFTELNKEQGARLNESRKKQ